MISIVIPIYNERESISRVIEELKSHQPFAEIIVVDDGSTDESGEVLKTISNIRVISFGRNKGKGFALYEGLISATGDICVTMDGDGQNDPKDINRMIGLLKEKDCVFGFREKRQNSLSKKLGSIVGNKTKSLILGNAGIRDAGCALKAFKKTHISHLFPFEGLHRFIPDLLVAAGLSAVELSVIERPRMGGKSKYSNVSRAGFGLVHLFFIKRYLSQKK